MAKVPYSDGVPEITPDTSSGDDYQHISANPDQFGGAIARGVEKAGAGFTEASKNLFDIAAFKGKVNVDYEGNNFIDARNKILYGDPSKNTIGTDGKPVVDTGYLGLTGRTAADQRATTLDELKKLREQGRDNLKSPQEQLEYDNQTRRMLSEAEMHVGQHAETQWKTWAGGVNQSGALHSLNAFTNSLDNPEQMKHHASDYINFKVQQAQIKFGDDATINKQAEDQAKRELLEAQVFAVGVKDPTKAISILEKNKNIAGTQYDEMYGKLRTRKEQQVGLEAGQKAYLSTYGDRPVTSPNVVPAVLEQAGNRYGVSPSYLNRTMMIESKGAAFAVSPTGAKGPFQFTGTTARQYGLTQPHNMEQSADAAARLAADNKTALTSSLGHPPTDAELYLAHQQGAGGAAKLLANPTARAGDLVGDQAIRVNGGDPNQPASAFTGMWTARFNNAPAMALGARKADAYQQIVANGDLNENERQHALHYVNQTVTSQQIAMDATTRAHKEHSDAAADNYVKRMLKGDTGNIVNDIANDTSLTYETRRSLGAAAEKAADEGAQAAEKKYGSGFWKAYQAVIAAPDSPGRITDVHQLLERAGPGGDLTLAGADKLTQIMAAGKKSVDGASINTTKAGLIKYAQGKLSFEQDTGPIKLRDPKGEAIFNANFIPKFEAAYDQWIKAGKNPWEFLTQKNVDEMLHGMRSKSEMQMERMVATGEASPGDPRTQPLPPTPEGVDPAAWAKVVIKPPMSQAGKPWPLTNWAAVVNKLRTEPTPEVITAFNNKFGPAGWKAEDVLGTLKPQVGVAAPEKNLAAADMEMKLTPQERDLYQRHLKNLRSEGGVDNPDGSRSTLFQATVKHDGKVYSIPTVWEGKILPAAEAVKRVQKEGWEKFPAYANEAEAEARYQQMHSFMERDTQEYRTKHPLAKPSPSYSIHDTKGPGPAGYVGNIIRSVTPNKVQEYVAGAGNR